MFIPFWSLRVFGLDKLIFFVLAFMITIRGKGVVITVLGGLLVIVDGDVEYVDFAVDLVVHLFWVRVLPLLFHLTCTELRLRRPLLLLDLSLVDKVFQLVRFGQLVLESLDLGLEELVALVHLVQHLQDLLHLLALELVLSRHWGIVLVRTAVLS